MISFVAFIAGVFVWTLLEYVLHRFVFHERWLGAALSREHLEHHAKVDWFAPWSSKFALAVPVLGGLSLVSVPLVGAAVGVPLVCGVVGGWLTYEAIHRDLHVRAPTGAYGRWARRHHFRHHFGNPRGNHGVSTPIWDVVFRTLDPEVVVNIPKKHADRLHWMLDGDVIDARFADTYVLR